MVCEVLERKSLIDTRSRSSALSSNLYLKNFKGLKPRLFCPGFAGAGSCDVEKYVNSVSIWIFSTIGAWYTLRFSASVLFSWVCMFYCLMFFIRFQSFDSRCFGTLFALRSLSLRRGGLFLPPRRTLTQSQFSSSPSTSQQLLPRSTFPLVRSVGLLFLGR
jgi:hypothetical protein